MAIVNTANISANISFSVLDELTSLVKYHDIGQIGLVEEPLDQGSGVKQISRVFSTRKTINAFTVDEWDLTKMSKLILGDSDVLVGFSGVKALIVNNEDVTTSGNVLRIIASGSVDVFNEPFGHHSGNLPIHPNSAHMILNLLNGYEVRDNHRLFQIHNPNSVNLEYSLAVVGIASG